MGILFILLSLFLFFLTYLVFASHKAKVMFESKGITYQGSGLLRLVIYTIKRVNLLEGIAVGYFRWRKEGKAVVGNMDFGYTTLLILDPEIIRSVLVKDFNHFEDRRNIAFPKDKIFQKMLLGLQGEEWKKLRSKLSPTFTTGKIKRLFTLFDESGKKFVNYLEPLSKTEKEIDVGEAYSKFAIDVIASAVCGIESNAFDQREPSLFEEMGKRMQIQFSFLQILKMMFVMAAPKVAEKFGMSFFDKKVQDFFTGAITSSIHNRNEKKNERRDDFLQIMLEAREGSLKPDEVLEAFEKDALLETKESSENLLDDDGIVANSILFLLAGFDTTQSLLLFSAYALALNQDVQNKLRKEVSSALKENGGKFSYDTINNLNYLDMVINETLRFYPPAVASDRACTMDYKVPGTDFTLPKGGGILIPIYGLHHDPEYFPNPGKFDPERFSPENKGSIKPYTYLPFGQGPRNCIGMRFALAEVKVAVSHLVHNFNIQPSERTAIPMKFSSSTSLKPKDTLFLSLTKLN